MADARPDHDNHFSPRSIWLTTFGSAFDPVEQHGPMRRFEGGGIARLARS